MVITSKQYSNKTMVDTCKQYSQKTMVNTSKQYSKKNYGGYFQTIQQKIMVDTYKQYSNKTMVDTYKQYSQKTMVNTSKQYRKKTMVKIATLSPELAQEGSITGHFSCLNKDEVFITHFYTIQR